jgi:hypothetical protein
LIACRYLLLFEAITISAVLPSPNSESYPLSDHICVTGKDCLGCIPRVWVGRSQGTNRLWQWFQVVESILSR